MFRLNADTAGKPGASHLQASTTAQDYHLAGVTPQGAYMVIADGCSHGQIDKDEVLRKMGLIFRTDVGARLLALATRQALENLMPSLAEAEDIPTLLRETMRAAQTDAMTYGQTHLGLSTYDLTSTCLAAVVLPDGRYWVVGDGDGAIAVCQRPNLTGHTKDVTLTQFDWNTGGAYYPVFRFMGENELFAKATGGWDAPAFRLRTTYPDGTESETCQTVEETVTQGILVSGTLAEHSDLVLFSDGIATLAVDDKSPPVPIRDAVQRYVDFLIQQGPHRARAAMSRISMRYAKEGYVPQDDLSMAVISVFPSLTPQEVSNGSSP